MFIGFVVPNAEASDIEILEINYNNNYESGDAVIIIESGKNTSTSFKYSFFDDNDDFPDDWNENNFNDSEWSNGETPFGNKNSPQGIEPRTNWQSEHTGGNDGENDWVIIRKDFYIEEINGVVGGNVKISYNDYYGVWVNGETVRDCTYFQQWACYQDDSEYWNRNHQVESEAFVEGKNSLVIIGRDSLYQGGDNTSWIDFEFNIIVQSWEDSTIILGDNVFFKIEMKNYGNESVDSVNVQILIDNESYISSSFDFSVNETKEWIFSWKPSKLGGYNITANAQNSSKSKYVHVGFYAYSFNCSTTHQSANLGETKKYEFNLKNEGDVHDNFSLTLNGLPSGWNYNFEPNLVSLWPGESMNVILIITVSSNAPAENYTFFPVVRSQYYSQTVVKILESGIESSTEYNYMIWNASDFPPTFYEFNYPDNNWSIGAAPFGDDNLDGNEPNTIWQTDDSNYTYLTLRKEFNYSGDLNFSEIRINLAYDNYYKVYLNENLIGDCLEWSWSCYGEGEYWEESINFNKSWLVNGQNLISIAGRDETYQGGNNQQWFDLELEAVNAKSSLWSFEDKYQKLTLAVNKSYEFDILLPIDFKEVNEGEYTFTIWILNQGNTEDSYNISVSLNDTQNFKIESYHDNLQIQYGSDANIELKISLTESIREFDIGNFTISIESENSPNDIMKETSVFARLYIPPDLVAPATYAVSPELVNSTSFEVQWYVQEWYKNNLESGNDTKYIIIQYSTDNGTNGETWSDWKMWGNFSVNEGKTLFTEAMGNHQYRFRSIGGDDDGKIENKEDKADNTTFVDIESPVIDSLKITSSSFENRDIQNNATNIRALEFSWDAEDNNELIVGFDFYYKNSNGPWVLDLGGLTQKSHAFYAENDGNYQFKIEGEDVAGNRGFTLTNTILIDTQGPNTTISNISALTDSENILLNLETLDDITNFTVFYKLNKEGENNANLEWQEYGMYNIDNLPIEIPVQNKYEYQFKVLSFDAVGNQGEDIAYTLIDRDKPTKIRNLQLSQGKTIVNSTTDVLISFMTSQAQDLVEYRIYRSNTANETGELIIEIPYGEQYLSYKDANVEMGKIYHYSVVAVDRMNFESEQEKGFLDLTIEKETVVDEEVEESNMLTIFIGLGIVGGTAAIIAFIGRKSSEEIVQVIGDLPEDVKEEKFSEVDGEIICNACGSMFSPTETSCPACGILKE